MSRIRGIEVKVQKELLLTRKCLNEILKKKNDEQSANAKDDGEKSQIKELLHKLPRLDKIFEVHRKIGEGTFSSVYLGSLRQHSNLLDSEKRWFAIKHLVPTAHPARIEHELRCLQDMGGKENVIGVELCLRNLDTIVFIMPYIPHKKFSEYVGDMDAEELRQYMRALLVALRHVHSFGVIHRDVKPSNFLYDRENRRYLLVDFGLAQRICPAVEEVPAPQGPPPAHCNGTRKRPRDEDVTPGAKRMALDLSKRRADESAGASSAVSSVPAGSSPATVPVPPAARPATVPVPPAARPATVPVPPAARPAQCACAGAGAVCAPCSAQPAPRAPRAGTQGFRPPEVLLKYPHQTTAVDLWASGVVLASALTGRYPLFRAADDLAALAELADLLGTAPLQRAADKLGRRLLASQPRRGLCLRKLARHLRSPAPAPSTQAGPACPRCRLVTSRCVCLEGGGQAGWSRGAVVAGFPDAAFSLAARLLAPCPHERLTAAQALEHPFFTADV